MKYTPISGQLKSSLTNFNLTTDAKLKQSMQIIKKNLELNGQTKTRTYYSFKHQQYYSAP